MLYFYHKPFSDAVSALVPLAKKFTSEEPSIETIGGENVISWPAVVSLGKAFLNKKCRAIIIFTYYSLL
jgi:hypothetical protein